MIPPFESSGLLPAGIHPAEWSEVVARLGWNPHRQSLLMGLRRGLQQLRSAGCQAVYLDGSFVTSKELPDDYDLCWSVANVDPAQIDPVLLKFDDGRRAMKAKYLGDLFPAEWEEGASGRRFLDFFQIDKLSGNPKGIVLIDLRRLS